VRGRGWLFFDDYDDGITMEYDNASMVMGWEWLGYGFEA
jgi:hypothetical protein